MLTMELSTAPLASARLVSEARLAMTLHAAATSSKAAIGRPYRLLLDPHTETSPLANAKAAGVASAATVRAPNHLPALPLRIKTGF